MTALKRVTPDMTKAIFVIITLATCGMLSACGFHLRGEVHLVPPLHRMYLKTNDPYGYLSRSLQSYLNMSNVQLVSEPSAAQTILIILQDHTSEELLSVSTTQQTRQYNLKATVVFEITDARGNVILPPQTLRETRTITIQSNQILGNTNEANLYYQQMRRSLSFAIMNRISSQEVGHLILNYFANVRLPT